MNYLVVVVIVQMIREAELHQNKLIKKLHMLFQEADTSGDGVISLDEFRALVSEPRVLHWLAALEVEVNEIEGLFGLLVHNFIFN